MPKSAKKRKNAKPTQPPATSPQKLSTKYIAAAASFVVIALAVYFLFIFQKGPSDIKVDEEEGEIKDFSEVQLKDRPYVTLTPTVDGAEIIVSIENMGYFDAIEYELTYLADDPTRSGEKIQRVWPSLMTGRSGSRTPASCTDAASPGARSVVSRPTAW